MKVYKKIFFNIENRIVALHATGKLLYNKPQYNEPFHITNDLCTPNTVCSGQANLYMYSRQIGSVFLLSKLVSSSVIRSYIWYPDLVNEVAHKKQGRQPTQNGSMIPIKVSQ